MGDDPIQYVPRSLRDDGMVPLSEVAHYTHIQFVPYVTLADHEAALAEKDKEIAKVAGERNQTAKEFDVAYQAAVTYKQQRDTLIAQAVRFAEYIKNSPVSHVLVKNAQAFLSTPEVQAYPAQQKEGG